MWNPDCTVCIVLKNSGSWAYAGHDLDLPSSKQVPLFTGEKLEEVPAGTNMLSLTNSLGFIVGIRHSHRNTPICCHWSMCLYVPVCVFWEGISWTRTCPLLGWDGILICTLIKKISLCTANLVVPSSTKRWGFRRGAVKTLQGRKNNKRHLPPSVSDPKPQVFVRRRLSQRQMLHRRCFH